VTFSAAVKPLQRPALQGGRGGNLYYKNGPEYQDFKATLYAACSMVLPDDWTPYTGPVEIRILCQYHRPMSRPTAIWKDTTPDWDNLAKPVQDALTKLVFPDDKTVVLARVAKIYGDEDRVTVQVRTVDDDLEVLNAWMFQES
jgi:Holliday junction resolvase RusA-like endonuclease